MDYCSLVPCPYECLSCPFQRCVACHTGASGHGMINPLYLPPELRPPPTPVQPGHKGGWRPPIAGSDFKLMRKARHIALKTVAVQAGLSCSTLSSWERGRRGISRESYDKMAKALDWVPIAVEEDDNHMKVPRYKQILALGDTSGMTSAEIADMLGLRQNDVTTAIHHAKYRHGIDIPYKKVQSGRRGPGRTQKLPTRKEPQPMSEPKLPDRCKRCEYCRPESSAHNSPLRCHYCYDTGHTRGYPLKQVVPVSNECDKFEPKRY